MHSSEFGLATTSIPKGHTIWHLPHVLHLSRSISIRKRLTGLKNESSAPRAQADRQKGLLVKTMSARKVSKMNILSQKSHPDGGRVTRGGASFNGIAPSNVPTGHSLEYQCTPVRYGRSMARRKSPTYFPYLVQAGSWNLGEGILKTRSCRKPKGQTQPQVRRPSVIPINPRNPTTYRNAPHGDFQEPLIASPAIFCVPAPALAFESGEFMASEC